MRLTKKLSFGKIPAGVFFLLPILILSARASGQDELSDSLITLRTETIRHMLDEGKTNANRWWYGWLAGYGAATVIQSSLLLTNESRSNRQDLVLGAASTLLGTVGQIATPMVPGYASGKLERYPGNTREEKMNRLTEAEKLLRESALREKEGRSWKIHAISGAVNLGSGLITWIGFDRDIWSGLGNFALNMAVTEVQIFTQPTRAMKDYNNYLKKYGNGQESAYHEPALNWRVSAYPGGIALRVVF